MKYIYFEVKNKIELSDARSALPFVKKRALPVNVSMNVTGDYAHHITTMMVKPAEMTRAFCWATLPDICKREVIKFTRSWQHEGEFPFIRFEMEVLGQDNLVFEYFTSIVEK